MDETEHIHWMENIFGEYFYRWKIPRLLIYHVRDFSTSPINERKDD